MSALSVDLIDRAIALLKKKKGDAAKEKMRRRVAAADGLKRFMEECGFSVMIFCEVTGARLKLGSSRVKHESGAGDLAITYELGSRGLCRIVPAQLTLDVSGHIPVNGQIEIPVSPWEAVGSMDPSDAAFVNMYLWLEAQFRKLLTKYPVPES